MNHRVYRPCRYCHGIFTWTEMKSHVGACEKNPTSVTCPYCHSRFGANHGFAAHFASDCPCPPIIPAGHKFCHRCLSIKGRSEFHAAARSKDGLQESCKVCCCAEKKALYRTPEGRKAHHATHIKTLYGVTAERYEAILASQGGRCAICGNPPSGGPKERQLAVDHSHTSPSGEVRGLLCSNCNNGLGKFHDNPAFLLSAISYLAAHTKIGTVT